MEEQRSRQEDEARKAAVASVTESAIPEGKWSNAPKYYNRVQLITIFHAVPKKHFY